MLDCMLACWCLRRVRSSSAAALQTALVHLWPADHYQLSCSCVFIRLVTALQLIALVIYKIIWIAILDYLVLMFNCRWPDLSTSTTVLHVQFTETSKTTFGLCLMIMRFFVGSCLSMHICLRILLFRCPWQCLKYTCCSCSDRLSCKLQICSR